MLKLPNRINIFLFLMAGMVLPSGLQAREACESISHKPVKLEAWLSKRYEKDLRNIRKEFGEMGNTVVGLFVYPANNPSRVVAIGRCVPAYIAQHILAKARKYSLGTTHLVHQGFISSHWTGIGTSLFSENSMNAITPEHLARLMDDSLDTDSFQAMYRNLTRQPEKVPAFGLMLDNPKYMTPPGREGH
jgi:hypothetical protein